MKLIGTQIWFEHSSRNCRRLKSNGIAHIFSYDVIDYRVLYSRYDTGKLIDPFKSIYYKILPIK